MSIFHNIFRKSKTLENNSSHFLFYDVLFYDVLIDLELVPPFWELNIHFLQNE